MIHDFIGTLKKFQKTILYFMNKKKNTFNTHLKKHLLIRYTLFSTTIT